MPSLQTLLGSRHQVAAVLTRPDARAGRGRTMTRSPVGECADNHGIEVLTPARPGDPAFLARLAELAPDCAPIVAYGGLIPPAALDIPRHGWVNLHFSLLPAWRGAAPVHHALIAGDDVTGATTFRLEQGLDTGPVYGLLTETIRPRDTAGDLLDRLAVAGAALLLATLDGIEGGRLDARPQSADGVSLAPKVTAADAEVRWADPAVAVDRRIRSCTPDPGAWTTFRGARLKLGPVSVAPRVDPALPPGTLVERDGQVQVGTATTPVALGSVQAPGGRALPAVDWARGVRLTAADGLGR